MYRFSKNRNLLLMVVVNLLWLNVISSQIANVNLTSSGELLSLVLKTSNGNIAISNDFVKTGVKDNSHNVQYENGKIKRIDNHSFYYYSNDHIGKIQKIGNEEFHYYDTSSSDGIEGRLKEISNVSFKYHTTGSDQGRIRAVNNHYFYYSYGKLTTVACFEEKNIVFWIHDSEASYEKIVKDEDEQDKALSSILLNSFYNSSSLVPPPSSYIPGIPSLSSYSSSYSRSNYFRVKKERQVLKFIGGNCFKIVNDGTGSITSIPVDCSLYSGNYKKVRDEVFVLRYDDKVCYRGELLDGDSLIFEPRKCPKGKEKYRLIYH